MAEHAVGKALRRLKDDSDLAPLVHFFRYLLHGQIEYIKHALRHIYRGLSRTMRYSRPFTPTVTRAAVLRVLAAGDDDPHFAL